MYYLLFVFSGLFNIVTTRIYYNSVFSNRSRKASVLFWVAAVMLSIINNTLSIYLSGNYSLYKIILMISVNFISYLLLSFFFTTKSFAYRFLMSICLQVILSLAECITGGVLLNLFPILLDNNSMMQDSVVNIASAILSLLLISIFCLIWKKHNQKILLSQIFLICITPLCSLIFVMFLPYQAIADNGRENHIYITFIILLILNFLNYFFLDNLLRQRELQEMLRSQDSQIIYQTEKYNQLSNAYKGTRRIVHEIKHRDSFLISCMQNKDYKKAEDELKKGVSLDAHFFNSSSHNLVIDTFISSYGAMANEKEITYQTEINIIKDNIPVADYDLCILLGNLLDNSFNAAEQWKTKTESYENFMILCKIFTQDKFFIIHVENTSISSLYQKQKKENLLHGFGIMNVRKIVEKYSGFYHQNDNSTIYETTISIPIIRDVNGDIYREYIIDKKYSTPPGKSSEIGILRHFYHFFNHE